MELQRLVSEAGMEGSRVLGGSAQVEVQHIAEDSRRVEPGGLFFAVRGRSTDGHRFIPQALEQGAVAVAGSREERPEGLPDAVPGEAYSHEVSSAGFWPGGAGVEDAAFYSYAYPTPEGFGRAKVRPSQAFFHAKLAEFLLPYEAVRQSRDPGSGLMEFLQSTYEAAAELGRWDRAAFECPTGECGIPRVV